MKLPLFTVESIWGGSVTFRYVGLEEFPALLEKYNPQGVDLPLKLVTIQYFEIPEGVLVQNYWGPSGLLFEKIEDLHWMREQNIFETPDHDEMTLTHFQAIFEKEEILKFLEVKGREFKLVGETEMEKILQSEDGRIVFMSKNNSTCRIFPSKEAFLLDMRNMGDPVFLAVPGDSENSD